MSWTPFFDQGRLTEFSSSVQDHPQGAGGGLVCPEILINKCKEEYDYVVKDAKTTGNCAPAAFCQSAIAQGTRPSWKRPTDSKRCSEARKLACDWLKKHRTDKTWGGWSVQEIAEAVSSTPFERWLARLRLTDTWADVAFLHGLGCSLNVDVLVPNRLF